MKTVRDRKYFSTNFLSLVAGLTLSVAIVTTGVTATNAWANINSVKATAGAEVVPSSAQLDRLSRFDHYIAYFTSLSYGPDDARVSADYIRALILTESSGNPRALSDKGARGLTQIMPTTGQIAARELLKSGRNFLYVDEDKLRNLEAGGLYDPALNILIACHLNARYHAEYDGQVELSISAWNAGPGAVRKYGNQPPPYKETQAMLGRFKGYIRYLQDVELSD